MNSSNTKMCACPKFKECSAPICPLDTEWRLRVYRKGEPVCFYLLEYVKPDARARFRGSIGVSIYKAIERSIDAMSRRYAPLCRALERAKRTRSRMETLGLPQKSQMASAEWTQLASSRHGTLRSSSPGLKPGSKLPEAVDQR